MEDIKCGLITDVTNFLKTISDIVFKAFDKLSEWGIFTDDVEQTSDGTYKGKFYRKDKSKVIEWELIPEDSDGVYTFKCKSVKGRPKVSSKIYRNVSEKELYNYFIDVLDVMYGESPEEWVASSTSIKVGLKRVVGTDEDSIDLCGIFADSNVQAINDAINGILVDSFVETIPEEETWYEITDCGDEYDVNQCDAVVPDEKYSLEACLCQAFQCLSTFQAVHWNAVGKDFFTLHEKLDEYIGVIQSNIDELAEMYKQTHNIIPSPATFYKSGKIIETNSETGFDITEGFGVVRDVIVVYCMTLECYYCNLTSDKQSKFDEYLAYWNKESQYKLDSLLAPH